MKLQTFAALPIITLICTAIPASAQNRFPKESLVVNVLEYGAKPDDGQDDTDAIQKALDSFPGSNAIIYLPAGEYRISGTLEWGKSNGGGHMKATCLEGDGPDRTVLKLADASSGFGDPQKTKPMIYTGGPPAQRFRNSIRSLTIDSGRGNPGAVGASYCANNQGTLRDVRFQSGKDGSEPGRVGLDMSVGEVGPQFVADVEVIGFDIGVRTGSGVNSITAERIKVRGQREVGVLNRDNLLFLRKLVSENTVPAVISTGSAPVLVLIDSTLRGTGAAGMLDAIQETSSRGSIFLRDVQVDGYARGAVMRDQIHQVGKISEWVQPFAFSLFPTPLQSMRLPIKETPLMPQIADDTWVSPSRFGGSAMDTVDDTAAIQKAIDSGAETVYLDRGKWDKKDNPFAAWIVSDTLVIRGKCRRIIGLEGGIQPKGALQTSKDKPVFRIEGDGPPVHFERLFMGRQRPLYESPFVIVEGPRVVVISSCSDVHNVVVRASGTLFGEDVAANTLTIEKGGTFYGRQINSETNQHTRKDKLVNLGGTVWILGYKTEERAPAVETRAGGRTEILGGHFYTCVDGSQASTMVTVEDAEVSLAGCAEYVWNRKWATGILVDESRSSENRKVRVSELPARGGGTMLPLFVSGKPAVATDAPASLSAPIADVARDLDRLTLRMRTETGKPAGFLLRRVDAGQEEPWQYVGLTHTVPDLLPGSAHAFEVKAFDRHGVRGKDVVRVAATCLADTEAPTTPGDLKLKRADRKAVRLTWAGSQDNVKIASYEISREPAFGGDKPLVQSGTGLIDKQVREGSQYRYRVIAKDPSGNSSQAAELSVTTPSGPPTEEILEGEEFSNFNHSLKVRDGWFAYNFSAGSWALYNDIEFGRTKPFNRAEITLSCPESRVGAMLELYVGTIITDPGNHAQKKWPTAKMGTLIGKLPVQNTGGTETFRSFVIPIKVANPGVQTFAVKVERADAPQNNAIVSIDRIRFFHE